MIYLNKYDIKGETYVKLDELNNLLRFERKAIGRKMKKNHDEGKDNMGWAGAHTQLTDIARKINMSEDGEKYLIFTRDKDGDWEFLVDCLPWKDVPPYIRKCVKQPTDWVTVGTNEYEEATLYDTFEDAEKALRDIVEKSGSEEWHMTRKWMFDTKKNRESLLRLFYDGGEESSEKPSEKEKAIEKAESAIERTRTALDKTVNLLNDIKAIVNAKPSEQPQKPPKREVRCPGRYTVWYRDDGDTTIHCMGFVRFEKGIPIFTNRPCKATWFTWRGMAEKVAEKCGEGFEVVDMIGQMTAEERLLRAIFREDGMDGDEPCEWHGDGTKAEDEDWDGEEDSE